VLLVDADRHAREGLRRACDGEWPLEVVGEAGSVVDAVAELERLSPDVLVTDMRLTDGDGLTLTRRIRATEQNLVIAVLTMNASNDDLRAALDAGASALVSIPQIARRLLIRESTAETHVANLHDKLGVDDRDQAVMTALRLGLIRDAGAE
jgi:DNA-binding NarL/FixJ family response regulator